MKLLISELPQHLKRGLHPFYFLYGEEPFLCMEASELIRAQANQQGYTERECYEVNSQFDWQGFKASLNALSLFSSKRFIECRFREEKIGKTASQTLLEIIASPPPDMIIFCSAGKLDVSLTKSAWFTTLERQAVILWAKPLSQDAFSQWLKQRFQKAPLPISEVSLRTLSNILLERTEGNLLAAAQAIERLRLYFSKNQVEHPADHQTDQPQNDLNLEEINQLISVESRFSIFDLVDALLMGSIPRTKQIFYSLMNEGVEPLLVLWAITREVRAIIPLARILEKGGSLSQGFREHKVWKHKEGGIRTFLNRASVSFLHLCLMQAKQLDDVLKGQRLGNAWSLLYALCLMLARGCYV